MNFPSSDRFQNDGDDIGRWGSHNVNLMANSTHDWYLREWFASLGLRQADLLKLGFQKNTAYRLWHGLQQYRRDEVDAISSFLNIKPFELLMAPDEAMALRRLRSAIAEVAQSDPAPVAADIAADPLPRRATA